MNSGDDPNSNAPGQPGQPAPPPGWQPPPQGYPSAGGAPGYPQPGYQPGQHPAPYAPPPTEEGPRPGFLMPGIWLAAAVLVTLACGGYVGFSAWRSESAGVAATYSAALPFGMAWAGAISALGVHLFYKKGSRGVRVGVPLGCGCLGGLILMGAIVVFFVAIFPAL